MKDQASPFRLRSIRLAITYNCKCLTSRSRQPSRPYEEIYRSVKIQSGSTALLRGLRIEFRSQTSLYMSEMSENKTSRAGMVKQASSGDQIPLTESGHGTPPGRRTSLGRRTTIMVAFPTSRLVFVRGGGIHTTDLFSSTCGWLTCETARRPPNRRQEYITLNRNWDFRGRLDWPSCCTFDCLDDKEAKQLVSVQTWSHRVAQQHQSPCLHKQHLPLNSTFHCAASTNKMTDSPAPSITSAHGKLLLTSRFKTNGRYAEPKTPSIAHSMLPSIPSHPIPPPSSRTIHSPRSASSSGGITRKLQLPYPRPLIPYLSQPLQASN